MIPNEDHMRQKCACSLRVGSRKDQKRFLIIPGCTLTHNRYRVFFQRLAENYISLLDELLTSLPSTLHKVLMPSSVGSTSSLITEDPGFGSKLCTSFLKLICVRVKSNYKNDNGIKSNRPSAWVHLLLRVQHFRSPNVGS